MRFTLNPIAHGLLAAGAVSLATQSIAEESFTIEEVVVTATKRAQSTMDVPYNISAKTSEDLERRGITDFSKLAKSVPGLAYIDSGARDSGINSGLIIRGLNTASSGSTDVISIAAPTVSTYIGETPMFYNLHLKDIERVEIMRGPQGTLYGSGSLGGTIRYIHKLPDTEAFSADVSTRLSSTKESSGISSDTHAVINMPLSDNVAVRTVFGYVENQGFIDANRLVALDDNNQPVAQDPTDPVNSGPLEYSKSDTNGEITKHARVSVLWDINDSITSVLTYQHQEDNIDGRQVSGDAHADGGDYEHALRAEEPMERELDMVSLDVEIDMGFATLTSATSHTTSESDMITDSSGFWLNQSYWYYYGGSPREVITGEYSYDSSATAQELRLTSNGEGNIDWIVGAFYLKQKLDADVKDYHRGYYQWNDDAFAAGYVDWYNFLVVPQDLLYSQTQKTEYEDKALFGELTYHITEEWQTTLGARVFSQDFSNENGFMSPLCGSFCSDDGVDERGVYGGSQKESVSDSIFKFNTSYDVTDDVMAYFNWAEGFRHGGANGIPTTGIWAEPAALVPYKADKATSTELGLKGRAFDGRVQFSTALFNIEWEDVQINTLSANGFTVLTNGDTAKSRGIELEATIAITENLRTTVGYAYTDAELTNDFTIGNISGEKGDELPGVPDNMVTLAIDYTQHLDNGLELVYHLNGSFVDGVSTDIDSESDNYTDVGGYSLFDASAFMAIDNWQLSLFVDNIGNERAPTNTRGAGFAALDPSQRDIFSHVTRPRTVGMGVKYSF